MKRLMWKELCELRGGAVILFPTLVILAGLGHSLTFQPKAVLDIWIVLPLLAAFWMGLGGYARENAAETLPFVLSRPVRWWWPVLAKVGAGAIVCLIGALMADLVYQAILPRVYRPFVEVTVALRGTGQLWSVLFAAFLSGLAISPLAKGAAMALMVGVVGGFGLASVVDAALGIYNSPPLRHIPTVALGLAAVSSVMMPAVLEPRRRANRWIKVFGAGLMITFVSALTLRLSGAEPRPPYGYMETAGPDGWVAFSPLWMETSALQEVWVRSPAGRHTRVVQADRVSVLQWTPDGRLLYAVHQEDQTTLMLSDSASGWRARAVGRLPKLDPMRPWYFDRTALADPRYAWSPDGRKLALAFDAPHEPTLIAVDTTAGQVRPLPPALEGGVVWWQDNHRLVVVEPERVRVHEW